VGTVVGGGGVVTGTALGVSCTRAGGGDSFFPQDVSASDARTIGTSRLPTTDRRRELSVMTSPRSGSARRYSFWRRATTRASRRVSPAVGWALPVNRKFLGLGAVLLA